MVISGTRYRSIYAQTEVNWQTSLAEPYTSGNFEFSFSGNGGNCPVFTLKNGKILAPDTSLIGSYTAGPNLNFSGNIGPNTLDLYQDSTPLYLGFSRQTTGQLNSVYLNNKNNSYINFNSLTIYGDLPSFNYDPFISFYSGDVIPFTIYNSGNSPLTIFSGISQNSNYTISGASGLSIPAHSDGIFYLVNSASGVTLSAQTIPITIYSNIGQQTLTTTVSGQFVSNGFYSLAVGPQLTSISDGAPLNCSLSFANSSGADISVRLTYISGLTGNYYRNISVTGSNSLAIVSGNITGSGSLVSPITGPIYLTNPITSGVESGIGTGLGSKFIYAPDTNVSQSYRVLGSGLGTITMTADVGVTGYGDAINYSGNISYLGGYITGKASGNASGLLNGQLVSGYIPSGYSVTFAPYNGSITGKFAPNEYSINPYVGPMRFVTGDFHEYIDFIGLGFATGGRFSGKMMGDFGSTYQPGVYTFTKMYNGAVSGEGLVITGFDPVPVKTQTSTLTGYLSTLISTGKTLFGCDADFNFSIPVLGVPESIRELGQTGLYKPVDIFELIPFDSGEFSRENNLNLRSGLLPYTVSGLNYTHSNSPNEIQPLPFNGDFLVSGKINLTGINSDGWQVILNDTQYDWGFYAASDPSYFLGTTTTGSNLAFAYFGVTGDWFTLTANSGLRLNHLSNFSISRRSGVWGFSIDNTSIGYNITGSNGTGFNSNINFGLGNNSSLPSVIGGDYTYDLNLHGIISGLSISSSQYVITGHTALRTTISRDGDTPSGKGIFNNLFQEPFLNPLANGTGNSWYRSGDFLGWKESLPPIFTTGKKIGDEPVISIISGGYNLYGTGDVASANFTVTGQAGHHYPLNFELNTVLERNLLLAEIYQYVPTIATGYIPTLYTTGFVAGYTGSVSGYTTYGPLKVLSLTGYSGSATTDPITLTNTGQFVMTGDFSIETNLFLNAYGPNASVLGQAASINYGLTVSYNCCNNASIPNNKLMFYYGVYGSDGVVLYGNTNVPTGQWVDVKVARMSGIWNFYINGSGDGYNVYEENTYFDPNISLGLAGEDLTIGGNGFGSANLDGQISGLTFINGMGNQGFPLGQITYLTGVGGHYTGYNGNFVYGTGQIISAPPFEVKSTGIPYTFTQYNKEYLSVNSGGYYVNINGQTCGETKLSFTEYFLTGNYTAEFSSYSINPTFNSSDISLSTNFYSGQKQNGSLQFTVNRYGFNGYSITGELDIAFDNVLSPCYDGYSGEKFPISFSPGQTAQSISLPIKNCSTVDYLIRGTANLQIAPVSYNCSNLFDSISVTNTVPSAQFVITDQHYCCPITITPPPPPPPPPPYCPPGYTWVGGGCIPDPPHDCQAGYKWVAGVGCVWIPPTHDPYTPTGHVPDSSPCTCPNTPAFASHTTPNIWTLYSTGSYGCYYHVTLPTNPYPAFPWPADGVLWSDITLTCAQANASV